MKEWIVIHKVKSLYDEGRGSSIRAISRQLGIARDTVKAYISMNAEEIQQAMKETASRRKQLDDYRDYIIHQLRTFPQMSAVKILRKLKEKTMELPVSDRSMRRYIAGLKASGEVADLVRHYEPVIDMLPGVQCQVDGGELRNVIIAGVEKIVYFWVFVLSFSRLMHVCASLKPIDTEAFIRMHDTAFRAFGGMPEECVYDQTKLVVIKEKYRELNLNQRFAQYATTAGFRIHCCEGYDPESKGKVESGVKYVKQSGLYGETFEDFSDLEEYLANWLKNIANVRTHGTTNRHPIEYYQAEELAHMKAYLSPALLKEAEKPNRNVDKTGLINWDGNQYSVPMFYQRKEVFAQQDSGTLQVYNATGELITTWLIGAEKGKVYKNRHHYRDPIEQIKELEENILTLLNDEWCTAVCGCIKKANPRIYKDQLRGLHKELLRLGTIEPAILQRILMRESFSVLQFVEAVEAWRSQPERLNDQPTKVAQTTVRHAGLQAYAGVIK